MPQENETIEVDVEALERVALERAGYDRKMDITQALMGPHEWGYRDPVVGGFVEDTAPFSAGEMIGFLRDRLQASEAARLKAEGERDRFKPTPSPHEHMYSVVYRKGALTPEDYDEAIADLQNARKALIEGYRMGCRVCEDSGHGANSCHHNPLLLARKWASASRFWQCWHCGFVATNDAEGREHFGLHDGEEPSCVRAELEARAQAAELRASKAEEQRKALVEALPACVAQLRHAYTHLAKGGVTTQAAFAEGLIAPEIRRLEKLLSETADQALPKDVGEGDTERDVLEQEFIDQKENRAVSEHED